MPDEIDLITPPWLQKWSDERLDAQRAAVEGEMELTNPQSRMYLLLESLRGMYELEMERRAWRSA